MPEKDIYGNPPYDHVGLITNHPTGDAFGRLRVSEPQALHDGKNIFGDDQKFWASIDNVVYGTNRTLFEDSKAVLDIEAPAGEGDYVGRITRQSFSYQAGRSQRALLTGIFDLNSRTVASDGRVALTYGLGDSMKYDTEYGKLPDNGIVFARILDSGTEETRIIIRRKRVNLYNIERSEWGDQLNGKGPSKITIDWSKAQISDLDFEWLGVGRLRFLLNIDGRAVPFLTINNANKTDVDQAPYMLNPNLRIFYGAFARGGSSESSRAVNVQICSTVQSESGSTFLGVKRSIIRETPVSVSTDWRSILGVRIASDKIGTIAKLFGAQLFTEDVARFLWVISINPSLTLGEETWNDLYQSNLEYSIDINAPLTEGPNSIGTVVAASFQQTSSALRSPSEEKFESLLNLGHDGYDNPDEIHILVKTLAASDDFNAIIDIEEGY